ncbi:NACHT domain-containing protein [Fortiea contorta]|uniref:NACHT domain-containing protein n=1 Tax=Fortiea contorta TaxID=1892405 RepID=UPI0003466044|nr:NACHT domain-containing protein [Fortiea contorta]
MSGRSLQASTEGINKAKAALISHSLTQQGLAGELGISRQPITKFFQGKPIDRYIFVTICEKLDLDWEEIVTGLSFPEMETAASISEIEALVQTTREKVFESIYRRCGVMRVLSMEQPMRLEDIYTDVDILERVTSRRRLSVAQLLENVDLPQKRFPGIEVVERDDKLMILGKPGTGKTIFLKWLALLCNWGEWKSASVPIFITLKDFAETRGQPSLLEYIATQWAECGVVTIPVTETLLNQGRGMVLLDGLDAVREGDIERVLREIRQFTARFYRNWLAIATQIASQEYIFEQFTEVEIADFNYQQITDFVSKWFSSQEPEKTANFLNELRANLPLQQLATNPLILTLLCLMFTDKGSFYGQFGEIYQEALDIFLHKWDAQRHIERSPIIQQFSRQQQQDLLAQIARLTWQQSQYFFPKTLIAAQITEYLHHLGNCTTDSETILKSLMESKGLLVEQAVGIYSFAHFAFQQYLAEKNSAS